MIVGESEWTGVRVLEFVPIGRTIDVINVWQQIDSFVHNKIIIIMAFEAGRSREQRYRRSDSNNEIYGK